jgi:hypothetical protein
MLADIGQTCVSAYVTHSPWKDDTYARCDMVEVRQPDGSFTSTIVSSIPIAGCHVISINGAISCFTLPWGGAFDAWTQPPVSIIMGQLGYQFPECKVLEKVSC